MSKFNLTKKISLGSVLGEGHENDYMNFVPLSFPDAKELQTITQGIDPNNLKDAEEALERADTAILFIKERFISGKITDEASKQQVEVEADDFTNGNLPINVLNFCMRQLMGEKPEGFTQG